MDYETLLINPVPPIPLPSLVLEKQPPSNIFPEQLQTDLLNVFKNYISPTYKKYHKHICNIKIRIKSTKKGINVIFGQGEFQPVTFDTEELHKLCDPILLNVIELYKQIEPKRSTCMICYNISQKILKVLTPGSNPITIFKIT